MIDFTEGECLALALYSYDFSYEMQGILKGKKFYFTHWVYFDVIVKIKIPSSSDQNYFFLKHLVKCVLI